MIQLLLAIKLNDPTICVLLRGNNECRNMTEHFTFREECIQKFDEDVYNALMDGFDAMPLSCLYNE